MDLKNRKFLIFQENFRHKFSTKEADKNLRRFREVNTIYEELRLKPVWQGLNELISDIWTSNEKLETFTILNSNFIQIFMFFSEQRI